MDTKSIARHTFGVIAVALCSACGSGLAQLQDNAPLTASSASSDPTATIDGTPVTASRPNLNPLLFDRTIPNDSAANSPAGDYEYVINDYGTYATVFDYPPTTKQIGSIKDVGGQGCTNVLYGYGKKTFWIVAASNKIAEYAVPGKLIKTLSDSVGNPSSCAMNAAGDLAVGILFDNRGKGGGDVIIFKHASGSGTVIKTPLTKEYFDGYDDKGNLFFDGFASSFVCQLLEIPKGSTKVEHIITSNAVAFPGSVQWDGKYLAVTDQASNEIYRYTVSGTHATLESTVSLSGSSDCAQTWIATGVVYCGDAGNNDGEVFKYPAGSPIVATFTGKFDVPLGVVAARQ